MSRWLKGSLKGKLQLLEKSTIEYSIIHDALVETYANILVQYNDGSDYSEVICQGAAGFLNFFTGYLFSAIGLSVEENEEMHKLIITNSGMRAGEIDSES